MRVRQLGLAFIVGVMVLGTGVPLVRADDQTDTQARKFYDEGQTHYAIGEFSQAIAAYKKAFGLSKRPTLLFNIAQAYRLSKDFQQAKFFYESFLREMPATPNRADVEQRVKEMDEAIAKQDQAARPPNDSVPPGGVPVPAKIPSPDKVAAASPPAGADLLAHTDRPSGSRPIYKKWWFWAGVGAAAVGAAVTVVALSGGGTASAPGTDLGNHNVFGSTP